MPWIVAMTRPNNEQIACDNLRRQGYTFYCPRYWHSVKGKKSVLRPLFPRYIFVQIEQRWFSISGTRGISHIIMGANYPQVVDEVIISTLKSREDGKGAYQLATPDRFTRGDKVKVVSGPLEGVPLIYEGMSAHDRVRVLAQLFGREVYINVEQDQLVAA